MTDMDSNYERALRIAGYLPKDDEDEVEGLEARLISYEDIVVEPRRAKVRIEGVDIENLERRYGYRRD